MYSSLSSEIDLDKFLINLSDGLYFILDKFDKYFVLETYILTSNLCID